jgi:hypothetical protein
MNDQPPKKPRGCFFYGCITGLVLLLVMLVGLLLGIHYAKKMFNDFTDTKPIPLPVVQMSPSEIKSLHERIDAFNKALKEHRPAEPLILTADDINAWIATSPGGQSATGKVYVTIEGDQLKGQISLPLEQLGLGIFTNRYLNGTATLKLSVGRGALHLTVQEITVKGKSPPSVYMEQIRQTDLARNAANDPETKASLDRFEEIKIENGKLIIVPKKPEKESSQPPAETKTEAVGNK